MSIQAFDFLLNLIKPILNSRYQYGRPREDIKKNLLAFIWILATPDSYRSVSCRFNLGKSTLSDWFFRCVKGLNEIAHDIIKWPNFERQRDISNQFQRFANMSNVIGAIDGTYVPIKAPLIDSDSYKTRKCNYAYTLQAIAEPNLKFIDVFIGYPGSVPDHRIFINSYIYQNIRRNLENYVYDESFIIGDKAYPLFTWCIPPYINRGQLTPTNIHFNIVHSKTRQVVERSFALFFGRWRRFKYLDMNCTELIPETVVAGCVLHNICLNYEDIFVDEYVREGVEFVRQNNNEEENQINNRNINNGVLKRDQIATQLYLNRRE